MKVMSRKKKESKMELLNTNHTFAICAYKESPYLESCIKSLVNQRKKTNIILCTSTPNDYIAKLVEKYQIPYYIREGASDIRDDWNFAIQSAGTDYVTIAHQDDIYSKNYFFELSKYLPDSDMSLFITDYLPIKHGKPDAKDISRRVKCLLRLPMKNKRFAASKIMKTLILAFGNSICCPSTTYNKKRLGEPIFDSEFKYCIDWDTFLKYAKQDGHFIYADKPLMYYRIHEGSTSKECIIDTRKIQEDTSMFLKFWPKPVVAIIMFFYKKSYKAYD